MTALHGGKPPVTVRRIFSCVPGTGAAGTALALRRLPLSDARSPPGTRPTDVSRSLSHNVFYYTGACGNVRINMNFLNNIILTNRGRSAGAAHTMKAGGDDHVFLSLYVPQPDGGAVRRRILYESGLRAQLRRAPPGISGLGCTWALYVRSEDGVHAAAAAARDGTARSPARTGCTRTGIWRRRRCDLS